MKMNILLLGVLPPWSYVIKVKDVADEIANISKNVERYIGH